MSAGADLPNAETDLVEGGAGGGSSAHICAVMACAPSGTIAEAEFFERFADLSTKHVGGQGVAFASHHYELTGKGPIPKLGVVFVRLATVTAAAIGPVDVTTVTGTSAITFSGTPTGDEEDIRLEIITGGTIGTSGIEFKVSRDGGKTGTTSRDPVIGLGTASSYLVPGTGVTINFAAGTLIAGDVARAWASAPKSNAAGITAGFAALAALGIRPRVVHLLHEIAAGSDVDDVITAANALQDDDEMPTQVLVPMRDRYRDVARQGTSTVTFVASTKKFTRSAGSWVTDGFKVGMTVTVDGTVSNDGTYTVSVVAASDLTVVEAVVDEATVASTSILGTETAATWRAALGTITSGKDCGRVTVCGGSAFRRSPVDGTRKRRNAAWPILNRYMNHDLHVSPARKSDGTLEGGWTILDEKGRPVEHDERVDGGLLAKRVACLRTWSKNPGQTFVALPVTLDADSAKPLARFPVGAVADLVCDIIQRKTEDELGSSPEAKRNGTLLESEATRIDRTVTNAVRGELFSADLPEGNRASDFSDFRISRTAKVTVPGTEVPTSSVLIPLGTIEKIRNTVTITTAAEE